MSLKKKKGVIRNNDREVTWLTTKPTSKAQLSTNCKQDLSVTPQSSAYMQPCHYQELLPDLLCLDTKRDSCSH